MLQGDEEEKNEKNKKQHLFLALLQMKEGNGLFSLEKAIKERGKEEGKKERGKPLQGFESGGLLSLPS